MLTLHHTSINQCFAQTVQSLSRGPARITAAEETTMLFILIILTLDHETSVSAVQFRARDLGIGWL
jgi:hypothetical protein